MSDIGLNLTWWDIVLWTLANYFWPLTAAAAAASLWLLWRRTSFAARVVTAIAMLLWIASASTLVLFAADRARAAAQYRAELRARQTTLRQPTVLDGMHLPAGTVVTRSGVELYSYVAAVEVPTAVSIGGVPVVGNAPVSDGRLDGEVTLARDVRIGDARCSARATARFSSGRLIACTLARTSRIRGIPCSGQVDLQNGVVCTLSAGYRRYGILWRPETQVTDFGDMVWFRIGTLAPSVHAFGAPLVADSVVQFQNGRLASIDLRSKPVAYRGCTFNLILVQDGSLVGQTVGACSLKTVPPGNVPLPAEVVAAR